MALKQGQPFLIYSLHSCFQMFSADDEFVQICRLCLIIFFQTVILAFAWCFTGIIVFKGLITLPDHTVFLIIEYHTELTLIVTLISTILSLITTWLFSLSVEEALHYYLSGPIPLFKLHTAIALSKPTWIWRWRHLKPTSLTLLVYGVFQLMNIASWNTLLMPSLIQWPVELSGMELDLGSTTFMNALNDDFSILLANGTDGTFQAPAYEITNFLMLNSGVSAVDFGIGLRSSSVFNFNGVSYNQSTGGILPAVEEYAGWTGPPNGTGLYFTGGKVPVHVDRDTFGTQGIETMYTVTQQGFTANVTCHGIDNKDSFDITNFTLPVPELNFMIVWWHTTANCSGNVHSEHYFTVGSTSYQVVPNLGFLPTVVCPDPNSDSFNSNKFEIFMLGMDKYEFLQTTVCEVVPYLTTVNVTYKRGTVSVEQVGPSSNLTGNSILPLSRYLATVMGYQAGSSQAPTGNMIGDLLIAYSSNSTTWNSELEAYWRGMVEFSATQVRSGYSVEGRYPSGEIPSNMTVRTNGRMYVTSYGWQNMRPTFMILIVVITAIWGITIWATAYSFIKRKTSTSSTDLSFDVSNPVHVIVAASSGGVTGSLRELDNEKIVDRDKLEDHEDATVVFEDIVDEEYRKRKRVRKRVRIALEDLGA